MATPSPSSAIDSFAANQRLNASISNSNVVPSGTSIDVLASLKLINSLNEGASPAVKSAYSSILQSEKKWLDVAAVGIANSKALQDKLGSGFAATQSLAALLQQKQADRVVDKLMSDILESLPSTKLDNELIRLNAGGPATAALVVDDQ